MRKKLQAQIEKLILGMMRIKDGELLKTVDLYHQKDFYPDGVAQIYPLI